MSKRKDNLLIFVSRYLLVLLITLGTLFCPVTAFSLSGSHPLLWLWGALACLLFVVVFSLRRNRLFLLGLILFGCALLLYTRREQVVWGGGVVLGEVVNAYAQYISFFQPYTFSLPLTDSYANWAATGFLLVLLTFLSAFFSWAVVCRRSFWLPLLAVLPLVSLSLVITVPPSWPPLFMLLSGLGTLLLARLPGRRDPGTWARLSLLLLPAVTGLLVLILLLFPDTVYQRSPWPDQMLQTLTQMVSHWGERQTEASDPPAVQTPVSPPWSASGGQVDLSSAGPLQWSGQTVLQVETDGTAPLYLRGYAASRYTGTGWEQDENYPLSPNWGGSSPLNFAALSDQSLHPERETLRMEITNVAANSTFVYVPYHLLSDQDRIAGGEFWADRAVRRLGGYRSHTVFYREISQPLESVGGLEGELGQSEQSYREYVYSANTQLPPELSHYFAQIFPASSLSTYLSSYPQLAPSGVDSDTALRLAQGAAAAHFIRSAARYNPDTPACPPGEDPVLYFLQESKQGYCMHFASAAVLLLRSWGVPARYVSGYLALPDQAVNGIISVPDSSAHAWAEFYVDGLGWVPIEATPGYEELARPEEPVQPTPTPEAPPTSQVLPSSTPTPAPTVQQNGGQFFSSIRQILSVLISICALFLLIVLRRKFLLNRRRTARYDPQPNQAALNCYRQLLQLLPYTEKATPDSQIVELAEKARFSQHTLTDSEVAVLQSSVEKTALQLKKTLPLFRLLWLQYGRGWL